MAEKLQSFYQRAGELLDRQGGLDKEVLELLFCVEQATRDLEAEQVPPPNRGDEARQAEAEAHAERCNTQGQQHFGARRWCAALACFTDAAHTAPREAVYHANMAAAALKLRQFNTALEAAERALHLGPDSVKVQIRKARSLEGLSRWGEAEQEWRALAMRHTVGASCFEGNQKRCSMARLKGEEEPTGLVDNRPALPNTDLLDFEAVTSQLEAARVAVLNQPHSQVARAVLAECLIMCGRLEDALPEIEGIEECCHKVYLKAELALRSGDLHGALRTIDGCLVNEPPAQSSALPAESAAFASDASCPAASQPKLQELRAKCIKLVSLWEAAACFTLSSTSLSICKHRSPDTKGTAHPEPEQQHKIQQHRSAASPQQPPQQSPPHQDQPQACNTQQSCPQYHHSATTSPEFLARRVFACSSLLKAVQQQAPYAALLAGAHCMLSEAWLEGPEGGAKSALQALSQAPEGEPRVLWLRSQVEVALGLHEAAFCTLRRLQAQDPSWPELHQALQATASVAASVFKSPPSSRDNGGGSGWSGSRGSQHTRAGSQSDCEEFHSRKDCSMRMDVGEACRVLGLSAGWQSVFTKASLGRAFRRKAAEWHPDSLRLRAASTRAAQLEPAEMFIKLQEAYELLLAVASNEAGS